MAAKKDSTPSKKKDKYRIRNWAEYNQALINRGSITFWFSEEVIKKWYTKGRAKKRGRPEVYSNEAIRCGLIIKAVFRLPFRALQGLVTSLMPLLSLALTCPNYTIFYRRAKGLQIPMRSLLCKGEALNVIFDSTGVKVYGEGEWKVGKYGYTKRRTWRKVHIGRCAKTGQIIVSAITSNNINDDYVLPKLMDAMQDVPIEAVTGDMAYDTTDCRESIYERRAKQIIPPKKNARRQKTALPALEERDKAISRIKELGEEGRALWKQESGYHIRSRVETTMFRFKTILGDKLSCRKDWSQTTEVAIKCDVLNRMLELGVAKSYRVA